MAAPLDRNHRGRRLPLVLGLFGVGSMEWGEGLRMVPTGRRFALGHTGHTIPRPLRVQKCHPSIFTGDFHGE